MSALAKPGKGPPSYRSVGLVVHGEPKAKQRPRVTRTGTYTPKETVIAEGIIALLWLHQRQPIFTGPVSVTLEFYNGNKRRRDVDNMAKLVLDALNGHAYTDDYLITRLTVSKIATTEAKARTVIIITELEGWENEPETVWPLPV